jgi:hypothetical protein
MTVEIALKTSVGATPVSKRLLSREEIQGIVKRAKTGNRECIFEVRDLLADPKVGAAYRECAGSPAQWLRQTLIRKAVGKNVLGEEAIEQKLDKIRSELEGQNPTAIERLLAERSSLCWFIVHWYENIYANSNGWTIAQAEYHQRKTEKAHARFLSSLRTLAQVRKLAVPVLQLNIAKNQVNVAGSGSLANNENGLSPGG